jgi:hypothetical protein
LAWIAGSSAATIQTLSSACRAITTTVPDIKLHNPGDDSCYYDKLAAAALEAARAAYYLQ